MKTGNERIVIRLTDEQVQERQEELAKKFREKSQHELRLKDLKFTIGTLDVEVKKLSESVFYKSDEIEVYVKYNYPQNGTKELTNENYNYHEFVEMTDNDCNMYPPELKFNDDDLRDVAIKAINKAEKTYQELTKVVLGPPDVKKPVDAENEPIGLVNAIKNSSVETINEAVAEEEHKPLFELGDYVNFLPSRDYIDPLLPTKLKILTGKIVVMRPEKILIGSGSRATEEFVYTIQAEADKHVYDVIEMNVFQKLGRNINTIAEAAPKEDENIF